MSSSGHQHTTELVVVGASGLALGFVLGVVVTRAGVFDPIRRAKLAFRGLGSNNASEPHLDRQSPSSEGAAAPKLRLGLVVREDTLNHQGRLITQAARTVLGHFKKLYKRKDPILKHWEYGGQHMEVRVALNEDVLEAVQARARSKTIPTHTFAGRPGEKKERSVIVVGPATDEALSSIISMLPET